MSVELEELGARCSERVRALLRSGLARRNPDETCSRHELERLLIERGLPVYEALLRFEEIYGGVFIGGEDYGDDLQLGCYRRLSELAPDSGSAWCEKDGEIMVTIGTASNELCMGSRSEVCMVGMNDAVIEMNTSFEKYLEGRAMSHWLPRWCPTFLRASLRPALGDAFARALGISPMNAPSDDFNAWWQGDAYVMSEHRGRNVACRDLSYLFATSVAGLAAAIRRASAIGAVGGVVTARGMRSAPVRSALEKDSIVVPESQEVADGLRLLYDPGDPRCSGIIDVRGMSGPARIEQYRYCDGALVGWDSFSEEDRVRRQIA